MANISDRNTLIWLNSLYISNRNIEKIIEQLSKLSDLWNMTSSNMYKLKDINPNIIEKIIAYKNEDYLKKVFNIIEKQEVDVVTIYDENYPEGLTNIYDNPLVLYIKGNIKEEDDLAIGIVGSRKNTSYGKWAAERFAKELANIGVTVVSGLATGIDSIAHSTALEEGGRTIAVLGNGLDIVYPKKNKDLSIEISKNGAMVTEYFFGMEPFSYNFPQRNRIISGLSLGVIVIEAKENSGSLITAQLALEQGKEVFAVPGNINSIFSKGTNRLIKNGAKLIMDIEDIVEEIYQLQEKKEMVKKDNIDYSQLGELERMVIDVIKEGPIHCDSISIKTGLNISTITSILTILEIKEMIKEESGRIYTLA